MTRKLFIPLCVCLLVLGAEIAPWAQGGRGGGAGQQAAVDRSVPADLNPLLAPAPSEMRLVVQHYEQDRQTLDGNYASAGAGLGGGRGRGGRGGAGAAELQALQVTVPSMSPARIARLKRLDMNWLDALDRLDTSSMSPAAQVDLQALRATIQDNLQALEADTRAIAEIAPLVPFAQTIVDLAEARIRIDEIDSQAAAGQLTEIGRQIAEIRGRLDRGEVAAGGELVRRAAQAVADLDANLEDWFEFRDGYDPIFTWWMRMPYAEVDDALDEYATYLREVVAPTRAAASGLQPVSAESIAPAPSAEYDDVPDLEVLVALPHDELTQIVARFRAGAGGGRGAPPAGVEYYRDWLRALETLDFDALSRNAQVDYLFIRRLSEMRIERNGVTLPENPPRKADDSGIEGPARGEQGLIWDLQDELIPYTPEELIALAEAEFAWCDEEMLRASRELGFGEDWKAALEHVKTMHPPPGGQPQAIKAMLFEAVDYLREHDLLTVPQVATESFHMIMMSPERQLVNPFFTGGSRISVSYPTDAMTYDQRMQSMRGNNVPFSHATAHHEMIPGHNLTGYVSRRHGGYRANLGAGTPFFSEGWALYWELMLYARGFNDTPEERIGALFWRMHRCARIIFSLNFHMGLWSPQEAIDFLVDRVGHERENAIAEVRRSFGTSYSPLYQAAYLLGGLQLRALHADFVGSGRMTEKAFHDEILRQGNMPVALHRLVLVDEPLTRDMSLDWRFYDQGAGGRR
jgi:uncharacterized protein (DUF885 family)